MRFVNLKPVVVFALVMSIPLLAYSAESQLILKAKMVSIAAFDTQEVVDALDAASAEGNMPTATIVFKINSVVKGDLPLQKVTRSTSLGSQMKDSVKDKNIFQIMTMDYQNPEVEREDKPRWFAVGVQSPLESFKILSWKDLPKESYKLILSKESDSSGWILKSAQKA